MFILNPFSRHLNAIFILPLLSICCFSILFSIHTDDIVPDTSFMRSKFYCVAQHQEDCSSHLISFHSVLPFFLFAYVSFSYVAAVYFRILFDNENLCPTRFSSSHYTRLCYNQTFILYFAGNANSDSCVCKVFFTF